MELSVVPPASIERSVLEQDEQTPTSPASTTNVETSTDTPKRVLIDNRALWSLAAQHFSSAWGARTFEFASYLYLITIFPGTVLPASIFGFVTSGAAVVFSGSIGNLVDRFSRLRFVRACIVAQKGTVATGYAIFLILFLRLNSNDSNEQIRWILFAAVTFLSGLLNLATIAVSVSIERDWVTTIAQGDSSTLTKLNTWLRRVDLLTALLAPLFVSLLTVVASYSFSVAFNLGLALVSMIFEFIWINVIYHRLPVLAAHSSKSGETTHEQNKIPTLAIKFVDRLYAKMQQIGPNLRNQANDWKEFVTSSIFPSSLAISLLYMTVLSFDGTLISWLKSHNYGDPFVAGMRGVGVVTGLIGTVVMPFLEQRIGLVRTGTWSILFQTVSLVPVLLSFFIKPPADGIRGTNLTNGLLFTGMALSRIGLWSFDLCQLKELQMTLATHPRKNSIMALQFSLQNILDLLKYVLTMILNEPSEFKWAALASFVSVILGTLSYLCYVKRERGHVLHLDWLNETLLRKKEK